MADATSSDTCVAPSSASVPNNDTQIAISAIHAANGIKESTFFNSECLFSRMSRKQQIHLIRSKKK